MSIARQLRQLHLQLEQPQTPVLEQETVLLEVLAQFIHRHADAPPPMRQVGREPQAVTQIKGYSGYEADPVPFVQTLEELAGAEASVAWIVWNNALPCFAMRYLSEASRRELFSNPRWLFAKRSGLTASRALW